MEETKETAKTVTIEESIEKMKQLKKRTKSYQNMSFSMLQSKGKASELLVIAHAEMEEIAKATEILLEHAIEKLEKASKKD